VSTDEHTVAERGDELVHAVVVARDGAAPDVAPGADLRVAQVREVVRLRASAQVRLLRLDEVADVHTLFEVRAGAQPRERR